MSRTKAPGRLEDIAEAAIRVFSNHGYRNAQMSEIGREAGVSPGTLYLYVEGKEACFWLAVTRAAGEELPSTDDGPIPSKTLSENLSHIGELFAMEHHAASLLEALQRSRPVGSIEEELRQVVSEAFDSTLKRRRLIDLVESAARNLPELHRLFYLGSRRSFVSTWSRYLKSRMDVGLLRSIDDPDTTARLIIETVAWFAMHRYHDADSADISDQRARCTAVDMLVHGLIDPTHKE